MKKKNIALILSAILCFSFMFAGCGNKKKSPDVQPDVAQVKDKVVKEVDFPEMVDATAENIEFAYSGLEVSDLDSYAVTFAGSGGNAEEVAVVKLKSEDKVQSTKEIFEKRANDRENVFKGYAPEEAEKLSKAVVKAKGNYVFYAVCENPEKAEKIFDDSFK